MSKQPHHHPACQFRVDKSWLDRQYDQKNSSIRRPDYFDGKIESPPDEIDSDTLDRIQGSMIGMALGDALGASVEFRPRQFLVDKPVKTLQAGGTWGLEAGQFTDDTSMALCLANSLIARRDFVPYDQLVRYKWWYKDGYMSSTGKCFDIGAATKQSLDEFERRQEKFARARKIPFEAMDYLTNPDSPSKFNVYCSAAGVAGNGALMRLAPVPLFFKDYPVEAVAFSGISGVISHGDRVAFDACRYYGALIVAAVNGLSKDELLDNEFYLKYQSLFNDIPIHPRVIQIAQGSYKNKNGYDGGIRGEGFIVDALEAALWAFSSTTTFDEGALAAVNLGDDTDTTAAIYGQLAGAFYGYKSLNPNWLEKLYAREFIKSLSQWLAHEGNRWRPVEPCNLSMPPLTSTVQSQATNNRSNEQKLNVLEHPKRVPTASSTRKARQFKDKWLNYGQKHEDDRHASSSTSSSKSSTSESKANQKSEMNSRTDSGASSLHNSAAPGTSSWENTASYHSFHPLLSTYSPGIPNSKESLRSVDDVYKWIRELNEKYTGYAEILKKDMVDGFWLLNYIDDESLANKYQIKNENHRQHILREIEALKDRNKTHFNFPPQVMG